MKNALIGLLLFLWWVLVLWLLVDDIKSSRMVNEEILNTTTVIYVEVIITATPLPFKYLGDSEVYTHPTQKPMTEEEKLSGNWSDIPFDQNGDGVITCDDFVGENLGLDNLLDLAYNRYNMSWLDIDGNGVPCDE